MEELPIVTFGKYKDKPITELLADVKYVEWLKQQEWFKKHINIYNIVVNQTITSSHNTKTPEHNRIQNLFLNNDNKMKLLLSLDKQNLYNDLNNLFSDVEFIKYFGINDINKFNDDMYIVFEDKYNWDFKLCDNRTISIYSNKDIEKSDKNIYENSIEYKNYLKNIEFMDNLINFINGKDKDLYDKNMIKYKEDMLKYEEDMIKYNQDMIKYKEDSLKYDEYIIAYNKNIKLTYSLNYPTRPDEPIKPNKLLTSPFEYNNENIKKEYMSIFNYYNDELINKYNINIDLVKNTKIEYIKNYNVNNGYIKYKEILYNNIIKKYINNNKYNIYYTGENFCITFYKNEKYMYFCEIKPILSDDYPCVLRKMKTQIELTEKNKNIYNNCYILLIENFTSKYTTIEDLIKIFNQTGINILFMNDVFNSNNIAIKSYTIEDLLIENKNLKDSLLQAEEKIKKLENMLSNII